MNTSTYVNFNISELPIDFEARKGEVKPLPFKGGVGEIEGVGKAYGDLFREGSLTLGEAYALFNAYLLAKRGLVEPEDDQIACLNHLFDRAGYGNILETVADYDNGDTSMPKKESDRRILLIDRPALVVEDGIITGVKGGERKPKIWPANGYVGRTCDGAYDEDGVPFETWKTREEAEQTWLDIGADENFAKLAVSYAWAREEGQGKAIMMRWFFFYDVGRFSLGTDGLPCGWDNYVGRVPTSKTDSK